LAGEITFTPVAADHVAVARGSFRLAMRRRRFLVRIAAILVIGAGVGWFLGTLDRPADRWWWFLFGTAAAAGWLCVILLGTYLLIPRRATRLFRQHRTLDQPFRFVWDETGVTFGSPSGSSNLQWDQYHSWFENDRLFAFGLNEQPFHWAPKSAMTDAQAADLRATVATSGLLVR